MLKNKNETIMEGLQKKIQTVDNWGDDDDSGWDYDNGWDNEVKWSDNLLNERKKEDSLGKHGATWICIGTGKLAEYAARKYKSHRYIPEYVLSELNEIKL